MSVVDPPDDPAGSGWYFFDHPDRSDEGSNIDQRRLIAFCGLRGEVSNGGFDQWFFNGAGDTAPDALGFVEIVGHRGLLNLLSEALAFFSSPFPRRRDVRVDQLLALEEDWDRRLTNQYCEIEESESLDRLMDSYVSDKWASFFRAVA